MARLTHETSIPNLAIVEKADEERPRPPHWEDTGVANIGPEKFTVKRKNSSTLEAVLPHFLAAFGQVVHDGVFHRRVDREAYRDAVERT